MSGYRLICARQVCIEFDFGITSACRRHGFTDQLSPANRNTLSASPRVNGYTESASRLDAFSGVTLMPSYHGDFAALDVSISFTKRAS